VGAAEEEAGGKGDWGEGSEDGGLDQFLLAFQKCWRGLSRIQRSRSGRRKGQKVSKVIITIVDLPDEASGTEMDQVRITAEFDPPAGTESETASCIIAMRMLSACTSPEDQVLSAVAKNTETGEVRNILKDPSVN
jgi:hypothetical protein